MKTTELTFYEIETVFCDVDGCYDVLDRVEEDPEEDRQGLLDDCFSAEVVTRVWAFNPDEAIEKAAALFGYRHSGHWYELLNAGDDSVHLRSTPVNDLCFEPD